MEKIVLREFDCESLQNVLGYDLRDYAADEQTTKPAAMVAAAKGIYASALRTQDGELLFYNENYLSPLTEEDEYMEMTVRRMANRARYIVVKNGFNILAIIMPMKIVSEEFLGNLQEFEALCTEQLFRERARAEAEERPCDNPNEDMECRDCQHGVRKGEE